MPSLSIACPSQRGGLSSFPMPSRMNNLTFHQRFIIDVFLRERTVPKTIMALEKISGKKYKSPSYVRKVVHIFRTAPDGGA